MASGNLGKKKKKNLVQEGVESGSFSSLLQAMSWDKVKTCSDLFT